MDKPKIAQNKPYVLEVEPGTYYWCSCGESVNQPYCDGSHMKKNETVGTTFQPTVEIITETKKIAWCGCKMSQRGALCDGTHKGLIDSEKIQSL